VVEPQLLPQHLCTTDKSINLETRNISPADESSTVLPDQRRKQARVKSIEWGPAGKRHNPPWHQVDRNWTLPRVMDSLWIPDELFIVRWLV
jgi:hypothetical protein